MFSRRFPAAAAVVALVLTSACAQHPDRVAPLEISSKDFSPLSCEELRIDIDRNARTLEAAARGQREARTLDTLGWLAFFFPPTLLAGDNSANLAVAKGTDIALRGAMQDKRCDLN